MKIIKCLKRICFPIINNVKLLLIYYFHKKEYIDMANRSGIDIKTPCVGENEYIKKWKQISPLVSPIDYRLFSKFIGYNSAIVPEFVLHKFIEPIFMPSYYKGFYNDKNMYDKLLPKDYLATSIVRCVNGVYCDGNYDVLYDFDTSALKCLCQQYKKILVKPTIDTGNGNRILVYEKQGAIFYPIGHSFDFSLETFDSIYKCNFVIQDFLQQCDFTSQFNPSSVNTFRIFTYKSVKDNRPYVLGIVFRIGKNGSIVDNNHSGGKYIGVNLDGNFANHCVYDQFGNAYDVFNDIDFRNTAFSVPNFDKVIDFSKSVSEKIFHNRTLDLDVMIDKDGNPKLIEFNVDGCSPYLYQFTTNPVFGEFTDEVIDYIKTKKIKD